MENRVAIFVVNYNMKERCDALCRHIKEHVAYPNDLYVIDNCSDIAEPSEFTNVWITGKNKQTTAGWLAGLEAAKEKGGYFAYWFLITSADFPDGAGDVLTPLAELLERDENAVGVHPALTEDSTTSWTHLITRGGNQPRRVFMIDNIASLFQASWFDSIGGFDPELRYAWGIDLETCWHARQQGRSLWVHEGARVRKITNIAYRMERMRMSADERSQLAGQNMAIVLERKYGPAWWSHMVNDFVEPEWR